MLQEKRLLRPKSEEPSNPALKAGFLSGRRDFLLDNPLTLLTTKRADRWSALFDSSSGRRDFPVDNPATLRKPKKRAEARFFWVISNTPVRLITVIVLAQQTSSPIFGRFSER